MSTKTMRMPPRRISSSNNTATTTKRKERESELDAPVLLQPACSSQLLAGYLAHEFLTRGTLLGQPWDPTETEQPAQQYEKLERYVEVAALLKTDGAQLAGIVNPSQLARFLQL